jgi:HEAT repeat protein
MKAPRYSASVWGQSISLGLVVAVFLLPAAGLAQPASERERAAQALAKWLEHDCEEGNLKALTRFRQAVVPGLIAALKDGASPESRDVVSRLANASYDELIEQAQRKPDRRVASGRDVYVERDVENLDAQYRVRAAQALAAIGGADARDALENALRQAQREDVRETIQELLKKMR